MTKNINTECVEDVLQFNPVTDEYESFILEITPKQAQYILHYHNRDNRKISPTQVNKIFKSIENDNWLLDGQPITFNVEGNLTEAQHRLSAIAKCAQKRKFTVIVVTGVDLGCFSKTASNKPRRPIDEIQRKYKKAHSNEASILGDLLKRRKGDRLVIQNAIYHYEDWISYIQSAIMKSGDFENVFNKFSNQKKTVSAFITLCQRYGRLDECFTLLELLDEELDEDSNASTLTNHFIKFWNKNAVDLSNEKRMDLLYAMLCYATDQIMMREDGMIDFDTTPSDLEHEPMSKQGVYRKFLA